MVAAGPLAGTLAMSELAAMNNTMTTRIANVTVQRNSDGYSITVIADTSDHLKRMIAELGSSLDTDQLNSMPIEQDGAPVTP